MNILLFGPPGAGKGTQSALLVEKLKMRHISTGDLFRAAIKNMTPLGVEAKGYMDRGQLVPDTVTINMVGEVLDQLGGTSFILDGFPRNVNQAEALDQLLAKKKLSMDRAVFLEADNDALVDRLSGRRVCRSCGAVYHIAGKMMKNGKNCDTCGSTDIYQRDDDKPEAIRTRLNVYEASTKPLKDFYERRKQLVSVDGMGEVSEVFKQMERAIKG